MGITAQLCNLVLSGEGRNKRKVLLGPTEYATYIRENVPIGAMKESDLAFYGAGKRMPVEEMQEDGIYFV